MSHKETGGIWTSGRGEQVLGEEKKKEGQRKCDYHAWHESVLRAKPCLPSLNRSETATDRITGLSANMTHLTGLKCACVCHCEALIRVRSETLGVEAISDQWKSLESEVNE